MTYRKQTCFSLTKLTCWVVLMSVESDDINTTCQLSSSLFRDKHNFTNTATYDLDCIYNGF